MLTGKRLMGLAVVTVLLILPVMAWAAEFSDVPMGYWAKNEIEQLANLGYLAGHPDGKFYPDNPVTRAEFAAMIVKSLKLTVSQGSKPTFSDVPKSHWAYGVIETVGKAGYITGYQGKYRPNDKITREEMAVIVMKISARYGYAGDGSTSSLRRYKDMDQISDWAVPFVGDATDFGYLKEVSYNVYESAYESYRYNRKLAPKDNATRAQAAVAICKLLTKTGLI